MGAKTWMLVYSNGNAKEVFKNSPILNRAATTALAKKLFPNDSLEPLADVSL